MCNQLVVKEILNLITQAAKNLLGEKLDKVILYGSYARGDYNSESDIDIMVLADVDTEEAQRIENELWKIGWDLGYEHDILITVFFKDSRTFYRFLPIEPFYQNVIRNGVLLSA